MIFKIEYNTHIQAPIERCFDLARSIDFHKISVNHLREEAIGGYTSGLMGENQHVLIQSVISSFRLTAEIKITNFTPPYYFSYEIENSFFKTLIHDYHFYDLGKETVMVNHLYFETSYGIVGDIVCEIFLKNYIKRILKKRIGMLREFAETDKWQFILPETKSEKAIVC